MITVGRVEHCETRRVDFNMRAPHRLAGKRRVTRSFKNDRSKFAHQTFCNFLPHLLIADFPLLFVFMPPHFPQREYQVQLNQPAPSDFSIENKGDFIHNKMLL